MNAGPDVERRISDWLAEQTPTRAPDRILPATFERTRHARQRRFGAAWRSISMNRTWQLATAAVVGLLIIGLGAVFIGGRQAGVGRPTGGQPHADGPIRRRRRRSFRKGTRWCSTPGALRLPEPSRQSQDLVHRAIRLGWDVTGSWWGRTTGTPAQTRRSCFAWPFDHGFKDPCTDHTPVLPAAGSGAAGLLDVIAGQPGIDAGPITDVTVGGHEGKYVEYTVTADPATCGNGQDSFWIWGSCPAPVTPRMRGRDRRPAVRGLAERP